tara:strand:- start:49 stop:579 length:531 start_codon:yes stop_codon:yes gene_type:complete
MARVASKKNYSKSNTTKKSESSERGTVVARARGGVKKKYVPKFSDAKAKAKKALTSDKAYTWKFGDAFRNAKKEGKKVFTWNNKKYTTQTKAELEAGAKEKEKFTRKGRSNVEAAKSKKGFFSKVKSALGRDKDWSPEAVEKRRMEKRVAWMKKRKNQGKSYSAKNLKELEAKLSS